MSDVTSWVGIGIGVSSLIISIIAIRKSSWAQGETVAAQKRIAAIEEQREKEKLFKAKQASLRPELSKTENGAYRLYLVNYGKAEARNIRVKLDGKPLAEHCAAVQHEHMPTYLGPGSKYSVLLNVVFSCPPPSEIEIVWDDDYGTERTYRTPLTV